jgi:hypothetical protein
LTALPVIAEAQGYALAGGAGAGGISPGNGGVLARFAVSREVWRGVLDRGWRRSAYGEVAVTALSEDGEGNNRIGAIGAVLVLRLSAERNGAAPYADIGVGPNWFSATELDGIDISTHLQFSPFVGLGVRLGRHRRYELGYRLMHFSNAGIEEPNPGLNYHVVTLVRHQ